MQRHGHVFHLSGVVSDALFVAGAWLAAYLVRFGLGLERLPVVGPLFTYVGGAPPEPAPFVRLLPLAVGCMIAALLFSGHYSQARARSIMGDTGRIFRAALLGWLALVALLYFSWQMERSRKLLGWFLVFAPAGLIISRYVQRRVMNQLARLLRPARVAIIGSGRVAGELALKLAERPWLGLQVAYCVSDDDNGARPVMNGMKIRGDITQLAEMMRQYPVECVIIAVRAGKAQLVDEIVKVLQRFPVNVSVVPDFSAVLSLNAGVEELGGLPVIKLRDTPYHGWNAFIKRAIDIVAASVMLAVLSPLLAFIALLIKATSAGPVLFRQERMGLGGRPFILLKFRSMRHDAEKETGPVWAEDEDPRSTGLGAILRRISFDELPQLFNVLLGQMSLVGPRPERPEFARKFVEELPAYMLRHDVKAGITGWAQIHGFRGRSSLRKRLQYDLHYINNWSLGMDVLILLRTPLAMLLWRVHSRQPVRA